MKNVYQTHGVDMRLFISEQAHDLMTKRLKKEGKTGGGIDLEMTAQAFAAAAQAIHGTHIDQVNAAVRMFSQIKSDAPSGVTASVAIMVTSVDLPFGKFQVAFSPNLRILCVCDENEPQKKIHDAIVGADHTLHCDKKLHDAECYEEVSKQCEESKQVEVTGHPKFSDLLDIISKASGLKEKKKSEKPTPETKSRIKNFLDDAGSNN